MESEDVVSLLATVEPSVLGRRIKRARVHLELTQTQLAGDDASVGYVSRIESGHRRPDVVLLGKIATRLNTSAEALLTGAVDQTQMRIRAALDHADIALRTGDIDQAGEILIAVRPELDDAEDGSFAGDWGLTWALTLEARGLPDEAIRALEDLAETHPSTRAAIALCRCYRESGDLGRAATVGENRLAWLRERGLDGSDEAIQLTVTVAAAHFTQGDTAHAVRMCRRAIDNAEASGSAVAMASAYWNASVMESERGAPDLAVPLAARALSLLDSAEGNRNLARLRSQLGIMQLRLDPPDLESAKQNLEAATDALAWSDASPVDRGRNSIALARVKLLLGSPDEAVADALAVVSEIRHAAPLLAVEALILIGQAIATQGDVPSASARYREAVQILSAIGSDRAAAQCWYELGSLLDSVGLESEAHDAYRSAAASTGLITIGQTRTARNPH